MNGEEFYEEFKDILRQMEVSWGDMKRITVRGQLTFTHTAESGKQTEVKLNVGDKK